MVRARLLNAMGALMGEADAVKARLTKLTRPMLDKAFADLARGPEETAVGLAETGNKRN